MIEVQRACLPTLIRYLLPFRRPRIKINGIEGIRTPKGITLIVSNHLILPMKTIPLYVFKGSGTCAIPSLRSLGLGLDPYKAKLGFEPKSNDHESFMLPLHYLASLYRIILCLRPKSDYKSEFNKAERLAYTLQLKVMMY